jgi:adenylyltransferase/sulfurtransferase
VHITILETLDTENDPFDRQKRIDGWRQDLLAAARVMVVGAGAIGNETLKNLALLGVGNVFVVDFDEVSMSNLSRTLLFRESDAGRLKTEVAAQAAAALSPNGSLRADSFNGDLVWELGVGVFRNVDVVLGCVDNVETRFTINRRCRLAGTPWIDAGINALAGHVAVYEPESACYQCSASKQQWQASRVRYSCDDFKRSMKAKELAPTVQVSSALASALQVQEAVKLICGMNPSTGKKIIFQGTNNDFDVLTLPLDADCMAHAGYSVMATPWSSTTTLRRFLTETSQRLGIDAVLDLSPDLTFVISASCRECGKPIKLNRPQFRIYDVEAYCVDCRAAGDIAPAGAEDEATLKVTESLFSLSQTPQYLLDYTLRDIGLPYAHDAAVTTPEQDQYFYLELSEDLPKLFPRMGISKKRGAQEWQTSK